MLCSAGDQKRLQMKCSEGCMVLYHFECWRDLKKDVKELHFKVSCVSHSTASLGTVAAICKAPRREDLLLLQINRLIGIAPNQIGKGSLSGS